MRLRARGMGVQSKLMCPFKDVILREDVIVSGAGSLHELV